MLRVPHRREEAQDLSCAQHRRKAPLAAWASEGKILDTLPEDQSAE
jgi:hypothetical protein